MLALEAGDYRLAIEPERGGSIARFTWRGQDLLRPSRPGSPLDTACFPLVPFSNRIAEGRFKARGREIVIAPNMPGGGHRHPLHGFGWLAAWTPIRAMAEKAEIEHEYPSGEWPWAYRARQRFALSTRGLIVTLSVTNLDDSAMPAGLGLHPYFPRDADTVYHGLHRGKWRTDAECLPTNLAGREEAIDWWQGLPICSRVVDTAYAGRLGPLTITWPSRGHRLMMIPSDSLDLTVVYTPAGQDFFCVEPVSHATDAHNSDRPDSGLVWLPPNETFTVSVSFVAEPISVQEAGLQ